jgi:hypothetical protein
VWALCTLYYYYVHLAHEIAVHRVSGHTTIILAGRDHRGLYMLM